jgi:hypothetical protein
MSRSSRQGQSLYRAASRFPLVGQTSSGYHSARVATFTLNRAAFAAILESWHGSVISTNKNSNMRWNAEDCEQIEVPPRSVFYARTDPD